MFNFVIFIIVFFPVESFCCRLFILKHLVLKYVCIRLEWHYVCTYVYTNVYTYAMSFSVHVFQIHVSPFFYLCHSLLKYISPLLLQFLMYSTNNTNVNIILKVMFLSCTILNIQNQYLFIYSSATFNTLIQIPFVKLLFILHSIYSNFAIFCTEKKTYALLKA